MSVSESVSVSLSMVGCVLGCVVCCVLCLCVSDMVHTSFIMGGSMPKSGKMVQNRLKPCLESSSWSRNAEEPLKNH